MLVAGAGLISTSVYAQVIDFQSLEHIDTESVDHGSSYIEDGFRIDASGSFGLHTYGTLNSRYTGSTAMFNDGSTLATQLARVGGGTFDLLSIDLAEFLGPSQADVTFVRDGGHAQTFTLDGIAFGAETFVFDAGFLGSTSVTWAQDSPYHQFDNIVVAIPEPSSVALTGLGAVATVLARRRYTGKSLPKAKPMTLLEDQW